MFHRRNIKKILAGKSITESLAIRQVFNRHALHYTVHNALSVQKTLFMAYCIAQAQIEAVPKYLWHKNIGKLVILHSIVKA